VSPTPQTAGPRTFAGPDGEQWEVREIHSQLLSERLGKLLGNEERRRGGWLVFESASGEKRRLSPFPPDWFTVSAFELERWRMRAVTVPPAPARRKED
jgi:hypothetical protein